MSTLPSPVRFALTACCLGGVLLLQSACTNGGCPFGHDAPARPAATTQQTLQPSDVEKLQTILLQAAREGDMETLKAWKASGFSLDIANAKGDTPLILAAYHGQGAAVRWILQHPDAAVGHRNAMGFTALDGTLYKNDLAIAKTLIAAGADVNAAGPSGKTALMLAAVFGRKEGAQLLLAAGAKRGMQDAQGRNAYALAQAQGHDAMLADLQPR